MVAGAHHRMTNRPRQQEAEPELTAIPANKHLALIKRGTPAEQERINGNLSISTSGAERR